MDVRIREARPGDRTAIEALLAASDLPLPLPDDTPVRFLLAVTGDGRLLGTCGWERAGDEVLLRSVAVAIEARGTGVGARLVGEALRLLDEAGHACVTLVTLDAQGFFARFSFREVERDALPEPIRRTREYGLHECLGGHWMVRRNGERPGSPPCDVP
ncbi:GNAT family N-acetyltransferase [bacterium]|nr:GNAT family N-acetyltransferase [bacterium]